MRPWGAAWAAILSSSRPAPRQVPLSLLSIISGRHHGWEVLGGGSARGCFSGPNCHTKRCLQSNAAVVLHHTRRHQDALHIIAPLQIPACILALHITGDSVKQRHQDKLLTKTVTEALKSQDNRCSARDHRLRLYNRHPEPSLKEYD